VSSLQRKHFYQFEPFRLDVSERRLLCDGEVVPLTLKAFDLLLVLVENGGHILEKDELMKRVWPDTVVEEANLSHYVFTLRKALGESRDEGRYIETIPKRGYRFVASVTEVREEGTGQFSEAPPRSGVAGEDEAGSLSALSETGPTEIEQAHAAGYLSGRQAKWRTGLLLTCLALMAAGLGSYFWFSHRSQSAASGLGVKSMAVLPSRRLDAVTTDDEYLGVELADSLITRLSNTRQIVVRPTSAMLKYAASNQEPLAVGREQRVDSILESAWQKSGDTIRVTAQLVRVSDGVPLWAGIFDGKISDVFKMQDSITEQVSRALLLRLNEEERAQLTKHYTENRAAYQLYLKGHLQWHRFDAEGSKKAIEYFNQAIALDPNYALAYNGIADAYTILGSLGTVPPVEAWPKAKWAAEKAIGLDATLAAPHSSLAAVKILFEWDWPGAEREIKRAIEINPNEADSHELLGYYLQAMGRVDEALTVTKRAQELEPLSPIINADLASACYYAGHYDEAISAYRGAKELNPNLIAPLFLPAQADERKGMTSEAIAECQKALATAGRDPSILAELGYVYAVSGQRGEAQKLATELATQSKQRYFSPLVVALLYAGLGEKDQAFVWLEKAYEARDPQMVWLKVEPQFDSLRSDTRFVALLHRLGLAP